MAIQPERWPAKPAGLARGALSARRRFRVLPCAGNSEGGTVFAAGSWRIRSPVACLCPREAQHPRRDPISNSDPAAKPVPTFAKEVLQSIRALKHGAEPVAQWISADTRAAGSSAL